LGLDDLASYAGVSSAHLCRLFKHHVGLSPVECVRRARLDKSALLLASGTYSVKEVSEICGFSVPAQFTNLFKQHFHETPSVFRKRPWFDPLPPLHLFTRTANSPIHFEGPPDEQPGTAKS
jgi:AraC-like DNA-binding protein